MPRSTIAAVGSKARCGSAVLISNERSTTSVALGADEPVVAPDATAAVARMARAARAARVPGRVRKRFMLASGEKGRRLASLFLCMKKWKPLRLLRRPGRWPVSRLKPASGSAAGCHAKQKWILLFAAIERVGATRMKTARGRGASRVGDFPRQSLRQEAAAVRMGHCADQRFRVRVERERP